MLDVSTERIGRVLCARVSGRIDSASAGDFQEGIRVAIEDNGGAVILDFEGTFYISSAGLQVVLMTARTLRKRNTPLSLCSLSDPVRRVFEMTGFDRTVTIHTSREEALAAVSG